jgi:hypothetical protein
MVPFLSILATVKEDVVVQVNLPLLSLPVGMKSPVAQVPPAPLFLPPYDGHDWPYPPYPRKRTIAEIKRLRKWFFFMCLDDLNKKMEKFFWIDRVV